ncbi:MAG: hypothetical protein H5T64_11325 [Chloroflexi bacterium]|nr:hypothetical protein [Chloroflexota bacterium]
MSRKEQIGTTVSLILIGIVLSVFVDSPVRPLSIPGLLNPVFLSGRTLFVIILIALACAGQEIIIWSDSHTQEARRNNSFVHWILPAALTMAAALIFPRLTGLREQVAGLAVVGVFLAATMEGEYLLAQPGANRCEWLPLLMDTFTYSIAFLLFALTLDALKPSVGQALAIAAVTGVLSLRLFPPRRDGTRAWGVVGLGIPTALASAILPALPLNVPSAATLLVAIMYISVGLARAHLYATLTRRVLTEYGLLLLATVFLILTFSARMR